MENIIDLLHDIEIKANQIINRANDEKVKLHEALNQDLVKLNDEIEKETEGKLSILRSQIDKELATEKQAIIKDYEKQIFNLEANYKKNHDSLVQTIMQNIIKE